MCCPQTQPPVFLLSWVHEKPYADHVLTHMQLVRSHRSNTYWLPKTPAFWKQRSTNTGRVLWKAVCLGSKGFKDLCVIRNNIEYFSRADFLIWGLHFHKEGCWLGQDCGGATLPIPPSALYLDNGFTAAESRAVLLFPIELSGWSLF